jgi:adenylate cyclase
MRSGTGAFPVRSKRILRDNRQLKLLLLTLTALVAIGLGLAGYATSVLKTLEGQTIDTRFSIRGKERAPSNIVLVTIDSKSFQDLDKQWPFPRALDGKLIGTILAEHPRAVAFDVQTSEPSELGQKDDNALLDALDSHHGLTVVSNTEPDEQGNIMFVGDPNGLKLLHSVGAQAGNGGFPVGPGAVIRRTVYSIGGLTALDVVTAKIATHKPVDPRKFAGAGAWIDFLGPAGTFRSVSFSTVVGYKGQPASERLPPDFFKNKIAVIGATAPNLQDLHATSTDPQMPGVEIHANAVDTILRGFPLTSAPGWLNVVLIVLMGVAVPLISMRLGPIPSMALAVAIGVGFAVAVMLAFSAGLIVAFVYAEAALILSSIGALAVQLVTEAFERIRVRDLFSRFVPENVVDEVLASADGLRLGGIQREGTVMFSDLRGFTSFAESLTPDQVIDVLNHYLSEMSDAILNHGGTLVAYMGDGIMAVFGAPLPQSDHADRALAAAREMLQVRLPRFNAWLQSESLGDGFRMGIGLNSGPVMSGQVGSERRVEYTAVGDTTNTASRIEGLTKGTPHQLLLSDATRAALQEPAEDLVYFEEVEIRGRVGRMKLWGEPVDAPASAAVPAAAGPITDPEA